MWIWKIKVEINLCWSLEEQIVLLTFVQHNSYFASQGFLFFALKKNEI